MSRRAPDSPLPFSKVMDRQDWGDLELYTQVIDRYPGALQGQHAVRRWEYAMAFRAIDTWEKTCHPQESELYRNDPLEILDVGGAGSNFWQVLTALTSADIHIVDPAAVPGAEQAPGRYQVFACPVEDFAAATRHSRFDILTCISVIEHVEDVRRFFRACSMLLKPGGLVVFTTDFWDKEGPDVAHFHWMRKRIYNEGSIRKLLTGLRELGYRSFGAADWSYHGDQVYDYSVCSVAMTKRVGGIGG